MPLSPTDRGLLILTSLADGPKHGYALMQDIESFAEVKLTPGSLYGAIARLEADGYIEPLPEQERRHPYRITAAGSSALRGELLKSAQITGVGLGRLAAS
jgi:DNA-binding PadR family transcriptional regulator